MIIRVIKNEWKKNGEEKIEETKKQNLWPVKSHECIRVNECGRYQHYNARSVDTSNHEAHDVGR